MLFVVSLLDATAAGRLVQGDAHGIGDGICVHDDAACRIARRAPDGLNQAALVAQEALFVCVQDAHERHLGQVESLSQQVNAHQHVKLSRAQIAQNLNTLKRAYIAVEIIGLNALIQEVIGKLLCHLLGKRCDEHALAGGHHVVDLSQNVVDLAFGRTHIYLGIQKARGANDLLYGLLAYALLVITRRGAHVDKLRNTLLKLVKAQWAVIQRARQAKPVLYQRYLAATVALMHAAYLRDGNVTLIDDRQKALAAKIIQQCVRRLTGAAAVQMHRVVLDAGTKAHGLEHLDVKARTLLQALSLKQLAVIPKLLQAAAQLCIYALKRVLNAGTARDIVACRPNGCGLIGDELLTGNLVDLGYGVDLVAKKLDAQEVVAIRREHVYDIAAHAKSAAYWLVVIAIVLDVDEPVDKLIAVHGDVAV